MLKFVLTPTVLPISVWSGRGLEGKLVRQMDRIYEGYGGQSAL